MHLDIIHKEIERKIENCFFLNLFVHKNILQLQLVNKIPNLALNQQAIKVETIQFNLLF